MRLRLSQGGARPYFRLIDSCITQLEAQGPSRTCNENKEEEEDLISREGCDASVVLGGDVVFPRVGQQQPVWVSGQ